jgi:hypothetical protein
MADTKQHAGHTGSAPVEGDGIHYAGIGWFVVILTATTLFCMALVWGVFELMSSNADRRDVARPAVAGPAVTPGIVDGRIVGGTSRPGPEMLVVEPTVLEAFRAGEHEALTTYGWVDQNAGIVRIPIARAKELMLERGLPTR